MDATPSESTPTGWRYRVGVALLVLSFVLPLVALVVVPLFGFPENVNSVLFALSIVGVPDLLMILAVAAMGRDNIERIVGRIAPWFKRLLRWDEVTRTRYVIGLWILSIAVVLPVAIGLFFDDAVARADNTPGWAYYVMVASDVAFGLTFFAMGAPLWDRVRAIFTWDAEIRFPEGDSVSA